MPPYPMLEAPVQKTNPSNAAPQVPKPTPAPQAPPKKNLTAEQRIEINKKVSALTGWGVTNVEQLKGAVVALLRSITESTKLVTIEPLYKKMHSLHEATFFAVFY